MSGWYHLVPPRWHSSIVRFAPPSTSASPCDQHLSCTPFPASHPLCAATSYCSCWIGLFPCSAFIDFIQTQRQAERKGLFRKKLNGQVASWGWLSPLYWRGGKMSLLWRLLQQIASWLDECPQVRVELVSPAAKQEQIKGQGNPLELEARYRRTRTLFIRHSTLNLDWGMISGTFLSLNSLHWSGLSVF